MKKRLKSFLPCFLQKLRSDREELSLYPAAQVVFSHCDMHNILLVSPLSYTKEDSAFSYMEHCCVVVATTLFVRESLMLN